MGNDNVLIFPCHFPVKVFGVNNVEFKTAILELMIKHFPALENESISYNLSKNGKYLAVTTSVYANNKEQLDELYDELTNHPLVTMAL
jgi:uncharacterized protein